MPQRKSKTVAEQLTEVRKELLDLGLRNSLLNFRQPRGKGLELSHAQPETAFRLLAKEDKSFGFRAATPTEIPRVDDLQLLTTLTKDQLDTRLLATFRAARVFIEEQGVNTLFLVFGMLRWKDDNSDQFFRAPLILMPAELERADARQRFTLRYNGEEIGENFSLIEKLRQENGLKFPCLPVLEEMDMASYFHQVRTAIQSQDGWELEEEAIALGFFSFAKFLMYRDLDPETWSDGDDLLNNPLLNALMGDAGFASFPPQVAEDSQLDESLQGREPILVDNADSSQTLALVEALAGRNLIVQGPPGTGKSQTIVNLIAAAVGTGKKVLFVSEKLAALQVVKRRLDKLKLGAACLELHSNKTKKREVIEELRRTVHMLRLQAPQLNAEMVLRHDHRDRLNDYCTAVNDLVGESGETPLSIYGKLLSVEHNLNGINGINISSFRFSDSLKWTAEEVVRKRLLAEQLRNSLHQSGPPAAHPFRGSKKRSYLPTEGEAFAQTLTSVLEAIGRLGTATAALASHFQISVSNSPQEIEMLAGTARLLTRSPKLEGVDPELRAWQERRAGILEIAKLGEQMQLDRSEFHSLLLPSAWEAETSELREISAGLRSGGWWRRLSPRWHHAKRQIAALCATASPGKQGELLKLIDVLIVGRHTQSELDAHGPEVSELIGSAWRGSRTDFALLGNQLDWITEAQIAVREQKAYAWCLAAARAIQDQPAILDLVGEVERFTRAVSVEISRWLKLADYDPACALVADLRHQTLGEQANCFSSLASSLNSLPLLIAYNQSAFECRESGLADLVDAVERYSCSSEAVVPLFEKARLNPLLELAFEQRPALREFDGMRQHQTVDEFRRLDEMQMLFHRALVAARHSASVPSLSAAGQTGVLAKEFERKARFLPLRKLMAKAGNAVQAIKPVFMMSPLSIANYLPPGAVEFDIAIFDEASQVKPADALGAIVRSKQVVVVGDSKQLPPTTFFDAMLDDGDKDDETEETATDDIESVLGLFSSRGAPQRMLRWHYRSRHESLIAVSNRLFYDSRLVVFPSPEQDRRDLGLVFRHLPNAYYDRGGKRTNPSEAKVVAQAVFDQPGGN